MESKNIWYILLKQPSLIFPGVHNLTKEKEKNH